jgi:hypothetical protein
MYIFSMLLIQVQHTKNIHKDNLRKMVFWGEMCGFFYSENHLKLEMKKNSVTGWFTPKYPFLQIIFMFISSMLLIQVHILICTPLKVRLYNFANQ